MSAPIVRRIAVCVILEEGGEPAAQFPHPPRTPPVLLAFARLALKVAKAFGFALFAP